MSQRVFGLGIAAVVLLAACSPSADETTSTTNEPTDIATTAAEDSTPTTLLATTTAPEVTTTTTLAATTSTPTTTLPASTTSTSPTTTTTQSPTTTLAIPPDNGPPTVEIISPANLSSHTAVLDETGQRFGAAVSLSSIVSDPNGDDVTVQWFSSDEGALGTGESIVAILHTGQFDSAQPVITARATDQWGVASESSVQIIVWIPSDV